jgi:hypothetical protein
VKIFFLLNLILLSGRGFALCLPESPAPASLYNLELAKIELEAKRFEHSMQGQLPENAELFVQILPLNPRVNAEILKINGGYRIEVLGGMLNHPKMDQDTFNLLLCHELGHLKGGPPLKSRNGWSSTEGQADYFSGYSCARILNFDEESFLRASVKLTSIYAGVMGQASPNLDQCDETRAVRTNFGYPSVQCRLDTLVAGWRGMDRPQCWFME